MKIYIHTRISESTNRNKVPVIGTIYICVYTYIYNVSNKMFYKSKPNSDCSEHVSENAVKFLYSKPKKDIFSLFVTFLIFFSG